MPRHELEYPRRKKPGIGWHQTWIIATGFRILAFSVGTVQLLVFPLDYQTAVPELHIVSFLGFYTLVRALWPIHRYKSNKASYVMFGTDIVLCVLLLILTGGLHSPFLIYTLVPVATASLLLPGRATLGIASLTATYVIASQIWNPFLPAGFSSVQWERLLFYAVGLGLVSILPYLANTDLRQHLESEGMLSERKRLSHQIHDGVAQTVSTLRWQVQLILLHYLKGDIIDPGEVRQLESLVEELHQNVRANLSLMRDHTADDDELLSRLGDYRESPGDNFDFSLSSHTKIDEWHPEGVVETQLVNIFREALTNIWKHSGASEVRISIKSEAGYLRVTIADNGCGFDTSAYHPDGSLAEGQGLAIMQERAESIGGQLMISSANGEGAEIKVELPLRRGQKVLP
jgi:signal transduction histidine kinase